MRENENQVINGNKTKIVIFFNRNFFNIFIINIFLYTIIFH